MAWWLCGLRPGTLSPPSERVNSPNDGTTVLEAFQGRNALDLTPLVDWTVGLVCQTGGLLL